MIVRRPGGRPGLRYWLAIACPVVVLAFAGVAAAQTDTPTIDPATGALPQFVDLYLTSPVINSIILALSVVSLMLFLYFLLTINARAMVPADLVDEVNKLVARGKYEAASDLCRAHRRTFVASILQRAAENAGKSHSVVLDVIDSEGRRRADVVWNRISYLADVANVAPMLGLLGTVIGMIKAFFIVRQQEVSAASDALAQAIGEAMSTTMFGLIVAILSLVFYSFVKARATRVLADVEQAVHSVADRIKRDEGVIVAEADTPEAAATVVGGPRYARRGEDAR